MKKALILWVCLFWALTNVKTQPVSGSKTIGPDGDYTNLSEAFNTIATNGLDGPVVLTLLLGYVSDSEQFPLNPPQNTSATNTICLRPAVSGICIISSNAGATFNLNGVRYFIIDGRVNGQGNEIGLTISNTSVNQGCCIKFSNDACNNIIRFCCLKGVNTSVSSGGVLIFSTSSASSGNDNNLIEYCNIGEGASTPSNGIISTGSPGKENSGNTISHCNICNFYSTGAQCNGIYFPGMSFNSNWLIESNSFFQTNTRQVNGNFYAISTEGTSTGNITITNNYIGGTLPGCAGPPMQLSGNVAFRGMRITVSPMSVATISGNTIRNISISTSSQSQAASAISLVSGSFNCNNNLVRNLDYSCTSNGSAFSGINAGTGSPVNLNINNNLVDGIHLSGSGNCSLRGITIATPNPSNANANSIIVSQNEIGNADLELSSSLNGSIYGIISQSATSNQVISFNKVRYLHTASMASGNQLTGLMLTGNNGGSFQVHHNKIHNFNSASSSAGVNQNASVIGISICANISNGQSCYNNSIHSLGNSNITGNISVTGIFWNGPASGNNFICNNHIYSLSVSTTSSLAVIQGINVYNANYDGKLRINNNMLCFGMDSLGTPLSNPCGIYGISKYNGNVSACFNTVYIGGNTASENAVPTAAFRRWNSNADSLINNILVNNRFNSVSTSSAKHYSCLFNNVVNLYSDGNDYVSGGPGNCIASCNNGLTWLTSINGLQQSNPGNDLHSISVTPVFNNLVGDPEVLNLHLLPANNCFLDNKGLAINGISFDIDSIPRDQFHPDPGADEFTAMYPSPPVSSEDYRVCQQDSIPSLIATGAGCVKWYRDSSLLSLLFRGSVFNTGTSMAGVHTYFVTDSVASCESHPLTVVLSIDSSGFAGTIHTDTTICSGTLAGILVLSGHHGSIVKWQYREQGDTTWFDIADTSCYYDPGYLITTTVFRTVVKSGLCNEIYTLPVTISVSAPLVSFETVLSSLCLNDAPLTLTGGSPPGGGYFGSGVINGNFSPFIAGVGSHIITYLWTDQYGCSSSSENSIIVYPAPAVSLYGLQENFCLNDYPLVLQGADPPGGEYSGIGISGGIFNPSIAGTGEHEVIYTVSDVNNCNAIATGTIRVNSLPQNFILYGTSDYCAGSQGVDVLLSGSEASVLYTLYKNDSLDEGSLYGSGNVLEWPGQTEGYFTVLAEDSSSGCIVVMNGVLNVTENLNPDIYSISTPGHYCFGSEGASITISGSQTGVSYQLYNNNVAVGSVIFGTGEVLEWTGNYAGTYTVSGRSDATACSLVMDGIAEITEDSLLYVSIVPEIAYVAIDSSLELEAIPSGGSTPYLVYQWTGSNTALLSSPGIQNPVFVSGIPGDYIFKASVTDNHACSAEGEITVHVTAEVMPAAINEKLRCGNGTLLMEAEAGEGGNTVQFSLDGINISETDSLPPFGFMTPQLMEGEELIVFARTYNTVNGLSSIWTNATAHSVASVVGGNLTANASVCTGQPPPMLQLTNQLGSILQWQKSLNQGEWSVINTIEDHYYEIPLSTGEWQYRVKVGIDACPEAFSDTVIIIVNQPPAGGIVVGNNNIICPGENSGLLVLSGQIGEVLRWEKRCNNAAWQPIVNTSTSYSEIPVSVGTWQYRALIVQAGCGSTYSSDFEIVVSEPSLAGELNGGGTICAGSISPLMTLSGFYGQILKWQKKMGNADWTDINCTGVQYSELLDEHGEWNYRVVVRNADCQEDYSTLAFVVVLPLPNGGQVNGSGNVCLASSGINLHLVGYTGVVLRWQKSQGDGNWININHTQAWYMANPGASGLWYYRAVVSNGSCGLAYSLPAQIMVYTPSAGGTVLGSCTICEGSNTATLLLTCYNGSIEKWQKKLGNNDWIDIDHQTGIFSEINYIPGNWLYRAVVKNGCCNTEYSEPALVWVQSLPMGGMVIGGTAICFPDAIPQLELTNSTGEIHRWQKRCNAGTWTDVENTSNFFNEVPLNPGLWEYRAIIGNGVCSEVSSATASVIVNALPQVFSLSGNSMYCEDEASTQLILMGSQPTVAYQLMKNGDPYGLPLQGTSLPLTWNSLTGGTYTVTAINSLSYCTVQMNAEITLTKAPLPLVFSLEAGSYDCNGEGKGSVILDGSQNGITYQLLKNGLLMDTLKYGTNQPLQWNNLLAGSYSVRATDPGSDCNILMIGVAEVIEVPSPLQFELIGGGMICSNDSIHIGITDSQQDVVYQLLKNGISLQNAIINGNGGPAQFGYFKEEGSYTVEAISLQTGCSVLWNDQVEIVLLPAPEVYAGIEISAFFGASLTLPGAVTGGVPPYQLNWTPTTGLSSDTILNPVILVTDTILYTLTATAANSCSQNAQVIVDAVLPAGQSAARGRVSYANYQNTSLSGVHVYLKTQQGITVAETITDESGYFIFPAFPDGPYILSASSGKQTGGVNTTDALLCMKSYVQMSSLTGIYHQAADVDGSGFVNAVDALSIQRYFIGWLNAFPAGKWTFEKKIFNFQGSIYTLNIKGLCYGDVNGSFIPPD